MVYFTLNNLSPPRLFSRFPKTRNLTTVGICFSNTLRMQVVVVSIYLLTTRSLLLMLHAYPIVIILMQVLELAERPVSRLYFAPY